MTLDELTTSLRAGGVRLQRNGDRLKMLGAVSPAIVEAVREHKAALLCQIIAADAVAAVGDPQIPAVGTLAQAAARAEMRAAQADAEAAYGARDVAAFEAAMQRWALAAKRRCAREAA